MSDSTKATNHTDEDDLANLGKLLVVRLWLAGAAIAAMTSLVHLPIMHLSVGS